MKQNKKHILMLVAAVLIALVVYNVTVFFWFGASGHTAKFWFTYAITMIGAFSAVGSMLFLGKLRDWLFSFPVVRYAGIYCVCQYTAAVTFMTQDSLISGGLVYPVQTTLLGGYWVLVIICLVTRDNVQKVTETASEKVFVFKMIRAETVDLPALTENAALRSLLEDMARVAKYSDPVSVEELAEMDEAILSELQNCRTALEEKNDGAAEASCRKATGLMKSRSQKMKILRRH
jgi:hypothetical protein